MDRYTLMCSKLTQLQDECPKEIGKFIPLFRGLYYDGKDVFFFDEDTSSYWLPTLEQLIEMLGKISWELKKVEVDVGKYSYEAWTWKMPKDGFWAGSPHKAILKLLAYERWGLIWSDEKKTWEE